MLKAEILAVDGKEVQPLKGDFFQLGTAQRLDLRVRIPPDGGAFFPFLPKAEGTNLLSGIVHRTENAQLPQLSRTADKLTASLDNIQELQLPAAAPLAKRAADRTLPAALGGEMKTYVWTINGAAYPNRKSLDVRVGARTEIDLTNNTSMAHPMHLHGHDSEVVKIDGERIAGALRDTVVVPPTQESRGLRRGQRVAFGPFTVT